jgi:NAD(P)-dependent dehydrogenase (short-subunit alcohol dehydrogenase family)
VPNSAPRRARTVLITGAAVRVGREIALSFAQVGWDVVIHYNGSEKPAKELATFIHKKGRKAHLAKANLLNLKELEKLIPALNKQGIKLDCLINNASVFEKDRLKNITSKSWHDHAGVHIFAPLILMRDFCAQYKGSDGNIINLTDSLHGWSISPNFLSYSLSKMGLENATRLLAKELAPNIRINAVAPGSTIAAVGDKGYSEENLKKTIPLGRRSSPEEVCDAIHFILSAPSMTGQVLSLSGGI